METAAARTGSKNAVSPSSSAKALSADVETVSRTKINDSAVSDEIWLVTFMDRDLGYFDDETGGLEPVNNPFGTRLSPMSSE